MATPQDIKFAKSERKGKKYRVEFTLRGKRLTRHFGAIDYEHYQDRTPIQLYSNLNHFDAKRRELYYKRHGRTNNPMSAKYWSNKYLW